MNNLRNSSKNQEKKGVKRTRHPEGWEKTLKKMALNSGEGKKLKPKCKKCRFQCAQVLNQNRQDWFHAYWALGDRELQRAHLRTLMTVSRDQSQKLQCQFRLPDGFNVCKTTFKNTYDLGKKFLSNLYVDIEQAGENPLKSDQRGRHEPPNKTPQSAIDELHNFLESLPTVPSHYESSDKTERLLKGIDSVSQLWRSFLEKNPQTEVGEWFFRKTVKDSYNFRFQKIQKDSSPTCGEQK